jgi:hypothetical protein
VLVKVRLRAHGEVIRAGDVDYEVHRYSHDLRNAPFDANDRDLCPDAGSCTKCPHRTGNQVDLFAKLDIDAEEPETCTKLACYDAKVRAHQDAALDGARKKGLEVIDGAFEEHGSLKRGYVVASAKPTEALSLAKPKTWKQLAGKSVKPSVAVNPRTGEVVEVYAENTVKAALPEDVRELLSPKKAKGEKKTSGASQQRIYQAIEERKTALAAAAAKLLSDKQTIEIIAAVLSLDVAQDDIAKALGWALDEGGSVTDRLAESTPAERRAFAVLACAADGYSVGHGEMLARLGIDEKAVEAEVKAEMAKESK